MHRPFFAVRLKLNGLNRAGAGAGAALDALLSVDHVLVIAFGDDAQGAGVGAGAALDAVVGNGISHGCSSLFRWVIAAFLAAPIIARFLKIAMGNIKKIAHFF